MLAFLLLERCWNRITPISQIIQGPSRDRRCPSAAGAPSAVIAIVDVTPPDARRPGWRRVSDVGRPEGLVFDKSIDGDPSTFFGDYNGVDAAGGRVVAVFPVLTAGRVQKVVAARRAFRPGTQELR